MPGMKYTLAKRIYWYLRRYPAQPVLDFLEESQWWPRERLEGLRNSKLQALIEHCYAHVPYYREVMDQRGLKPGDIATVADLPKLPLLTKDLVRENRERLRATNIPDKDTLEARSGGTTGEPVCIRRRKRDAAWHNQCYTRGLSWGGLRLGIPRILLFGGSLGQAHTAWWRQAATRLLGEKDLFLPAFELDRQNVGEYVQRMRDSSARHLITYTSVGYIFALMVQEAGLSLKLDAIFPTAEPMLDTWRDKIQEVFSAQVLPYYGCCEINSLGYQCGKSEGYHRSDEHAVMEVQLPNGDTAFSGEGPFLVTDLDCYAMPILRYKNNDAGILTDEPCPCGRGLGRILRVDGRVNDMLVRCDGSRIGGAIGALIFRYVRGAEAFQFIQDAPGQVKVRIVPTLQYDRSLEEKKMLVILHEHLGDAASIEFEYPTHIERTPAGKARYVINNYLTRTSG